jgi:hypothetical protein
MFAIPLTKLIYQLDLNTGRLQREEWLRLLVPCSLLDDVIQVFVSRPKDRARAIGTEKPNDMFSVRAQYVCPKAISRRSGFISDNERSMTM